MPITIRRAGPADAAELHDLAARTFVLATPPGTLQTDIDVFVAQHLATKSFEHYLSDPSRILLRAGDDGPAVGYSMLVTGPIADPTLAATVTAASDPGTPTAELSKFYVAPDNHGSGVAATLMAATLEAAAGTGARLCWLAVNQLNVRAAKFYAKQGFEVVGTKKFLVGEVWHDDYVLTRQL